MSAVVDTALLDRVRLRLAESGSEPTPTDVAAALRAEGRLVGDASVLEVVEALRLDSVGAGPLEALIRRPHVTDVLVNGPSDVYVDEGEGLRRVAVTFADDAAVRRLAQRLASSCGRRLDDSAPYVDVRLRDGTRFHAVLSPIAHPGTCLSLRIPARQALSLADLVDRRAMSADAASLLRDVIDRRLAFLVTGGTGTGKTTLLQAMLSEVETPSRLVIVEDSSELRVRHPHVVSLEARPPNVEGTGHITVRDLVRQALRMRPDRLVVGEVRGAEVVDLLAALNTGHEGGCGTLHANTPRDVPARVEALAAAAGLARDAAHAQLAAALHLVIHLRQERSGRRWLAELAVLLRSPRGFVDAVAAVTFTPDGEAAAGPAAGYLGAMLTGTAKR